MADFSKIELSGSTDGRPINITATGTIGNTIHAAQAGAGIDNYDEIWLWANNVSDSDTLLTVEWGGVSNPGDLIEVAISPSVGLGLVIPGFILQNSLVVTAFAEDNLVVNISGFVNRITS